MASNGRDRIKDGNYREWDFSSIVDPGCPEVLYNDLMSQMGDGGGYAPLPIWDNRRKFDSWVMWEIELKF